MYIKNKPKTVLGSLQDAWLVNQFNIIMGFAVLILLLTVYHFFSDGDFSLLMTIASLLVLFAFLLLVAKAVMTGKLQNVSHKTLQAYSLVQVGRLASILNYEGYLPFDKSGDWLYQSVETCSAVVCIGLAVGYQFLKLKAPQTKDDFDKGLLGPHFGVLLLIIPSLLLAAVLHPNLNGNYLTDVAWTFALYLEAVAIYPQIHIFSRLIKDRMEMGALEINFVFFLAVARLLHFIFWVCSYHELNDKTSGHLGKKIPGYFVVGSQLVNLALLSEFFITHLTEAYSYTPLPIHV